MFDKYLEKFGITIGGPWLLYCPKWALHYMIWMILCNITCTIEVVSLMYINVDWSARYYKRFLEGKGKEYLSYPKVLVRIKKNGREIFEYVWWTAFKRSIKNSLSFNKT